MKNFICHKGNWLCSVFFSFPAPIPIAKTNFARLAAVCALQRCSLKSNSRPFQGFFNHPRTAFLAVPLFSKTLQNCSRSSTLFTRIFWAFPTPLGKQNWEFVPSSAKVPRMELIDPLWAGYLGHRPPSKVLSALYSGHFPGRKSHRTAGWSTEVRFAFPPAPSLRRPSPSQQVAAPGRTDRSWWTCPRTNYTRFSRLFERVRSWHGWSSLRVNKKD